MRVALMSFVSGSRAKWKALLPVAVAVAAIGLVAQPAAAVPQSFTGGLNQSSRSPRPCRVTGTSTRTESRSRLSAAGRLVKGDVLVSNFNDNGNLQGTGRTIVEVSPSGAQRLFASLKPGTLPGACPGGLGLTTALVALRSGWVIVGSLPTKDGSSATANSGCLIVLDSPGSPVKTISGAPINGPWDMTALDQGNSAELFVSNVLNGTLAASPNPVDRGTVVRIDLRDLNRPRPTIRSETIIGRGFRERTDPAALVVGPTGLGLAGDGTLYVADSANNRIAAIPNAATTQTAAPHAGTQVTKGGKLNDPLGLTIAPGGNILTVNGNDGNLVETTPGGTQVTVKVLDNTPVSGLPNGNGTLFGLAVIQEEPASTSSTTAPTHSTSSTSRQSRSGAWHAAPSQAPLRAPRSPEPAQGSFRNTGPAEGLGAP